MWAKLRVSNLTKVEKKEKLSKNLNVNEEYKCALRTQSYVEFFSKAQLIVNDPSSKFSQSLLEPDQDSIPTILESSSSSSAIFSKIPELKTLMLNYFDISAEASNICVHLLKNITQIQYEYAFIQQALDTIFDDHSSPDQKSEFIISELNSFNNLINPFSNPNKNDFKLIHDKYTSVLHHLKSTRKKVARKLKLVKYFHKATGICLTATCGLIAIAAIFVAAHTFTALVLGPLIFSFPNKKKLFSFKFFRSGGVLRKVGEQLDAAAKGTYILNRDFDTMGRLVARLHDEVEHNKLMIQVCLDRREDNRFTLHLVEEFKKSKIGFQKQVEELEEHVYLSLVTINRARALVIKEMTKSCVKK